ncbi:Taurine catabolism dioxygenase TauD/TfdA [Cordyceps militaris CM01]|uniref:Taurine catabolism dioxygenase TauD/TfdA n=1 Tax=Cordyceps militaris (strain CM01) TaxID=983644 RepID=G3JS82_CORMM|nr:Taurine catabolism dioxygenase TauD/TfdA [Cordyceps militaris CM01]EGX88781.1 Taurine catabolism dioxygenase TauD/TfdA [Cordyceps militaris CM01]
MAPSLTQTETVTEQSQPQLQKLHLGQYKEIDAVFVDRAAEEGKTGEPPAKACLTNPGPPPGLDSTNTANSLPAVPSLPPDVGPHAILAGAGADADTAYPNLFPAGTSVTELTPSIGSEVHGIQLSTLSDAGKDELAHYVATRKVVAFRKQDFADLSIPDALQYGAYFGRHHIHPTSGAPEGHPEIHLVHRGAGDKGHETYFQSRTSSVAWHSDISYEKQPPGTTFLYILDRPETGGDTLFVDAVQAYKRLSPLFQERLHGLRATHSGIEQVNAAAARNSIKRREPVVNDHPIVRTHPATGEKALYVNPQFTRDIVGLKKEESDTLLKFLYDHLAYGADFQARVKWEEGTVVVWDNRVTQHTALVDWENGQRRHLARLTPQAERPFETPFVAPA